VRFARQVRGLGDADAEDLGEIERTLEGTRQSAREALVLYLIVPAERARLSALNGEGLDAEIAALCAPSI
jgi:hypothetical protein